MAKMIISGAPVYFSYLDKSLMSAVIMQLEVENSGDDTTKGNVKFSDHKLMLYHQVLNYVPIVVRQVDDNCFRYNNGQYINPYHPSVPTPPPNLA